MDSLIQQLTDNPILLAVALILVAVVGYTLVRRLMRHSLFLLVLLVVYIGYVVMTAELAVPEELQKGKEFIEEIADKAKAVTVPEDTPEKTTTPKVKDK